jgi:acetolactate synthase-1/2/3 large subunit
MQMTGGQALVAQLVAEGVTDVFGVPGVQLDWAVDALRQHREQIRFIVPRHEQATSYMADGYARGRQKFGVCMVVPGPGVLNAMAGLATAYACQSPVLCIAGNIHSKGVGRELGLLHEIRGQTTALQSVTKWQGTTTAVSEIPALVRRAVHEMLSGTPRPVAIEISHDVLSAIGDVDIIPPQVVHRTTPDPASIQQAADLLRSARRPVIYAGGGVLAARASDELAQLADRLGAPVVMSENGRSALSDRHPLALSVLEGRAVFREADVALVVGSRFVDTLSGAPAWSLPAPKLIFLNTEAAVARHQPHCAVSIVADARLGLAALAEAAGAPRPCGFPLAEIRAAAKAQMQAVQPQADWIAALRAALPDDGLFVNELTQVGYYARVAWPAYAPLTVISPGYQGTLGYALPTALGAALADPRRAVVAISGDGGFGWNLQELATARKYDVAVALVVFNDGHFGNVRRMQQDQFSDSYGVELANPDLELLAKAFGVNYARTDEPSSLQEALTRALRQRGPWLLEARVGAMPSPWPLLRLMPTMK